MPTLQDEAGEIRAGIEVLQALKLHLLNVYQLLESQERTVTIETGMPHRNPEGDLIKQRVKWINFMILYFEATLPNDALLKLLGDDSYREYVRTHPIIPTTRIVDCGTGPRVKSWSYYEPAAMTFSVADIEAMATAPYLPVHPVHEATFEPWAPRDTGQGIQVIDLAWAEDINTVFVRTYSK